MTKKVVLITGASNGMGYEAAKLFADKGWQVVAGARRAEKIPTHEQIMASHLDVSNSESNQAFVKTAIQQFGRIDVLINNAGYGEYGPTEEISIAAAKYQFDVNYFGAVELTNLVLPTMRQQKSGRIINISSIGGNIYSPLGAHYYATKAALQQWSDSLDSEIAQFGLRSVIIQPGGTASAWGDIAMKNAQKNLRSDSPYAPMVNGAAGLMRNLSNSSVTSQELANLFYRVASTEKPNARNFNSLGDRAVVRLAKTHPKVYQKVLQTLVNRVLKRQAK